MVATMKIQALGQLTMPVAIESSQPLGARGASGIIGSTLLHGLEFFGAAVVGSSAVDIMKTRRKRCSAFSSTSGGVDRPLPLASAMEEHEEQFTAGDFCPLYSGLPSISFSPSFGRGKPSRKGRSLQTRCAAAPEIGLLADTAEAYSSEQVLPRVGKVARVTKETSVDVHINLDGTGVCTCVTGIPFLDHMLEQLASHGLLDVKVIAKGDIHIDDHHTNEDVGLALGTALLQALGDRRGIYRFGDFSAPLDEALVHVVLVLLHKAAPSYDLSGRPYLGYDVDIPTQRVGSYDTQLIEHFFQSVVNTSGMTLHIRKLAGKNSHHIIEATFKAFARALRQAIQYDLRRQGTVPSSKGILSRA